MNSIISPRRLRRTEAIREMVRENHLKASDFIYPLFIHEKDFKEEISAMPGTYRWDINGLIKEKKVTKIFCTNCIFHKFTSLRDNIF